MRAAPLLPAVLLALAACGGAATPAAPGAAMPDAAATDRLVLSDAEWQRRLTPEQYRVLRRKGTEAPFCGGYVQAKAHGPGAYHCAGCGAPLFAAGAKFESGTGWPSFFAPLEGRVATEEDRSHGMLRTEVHCARCDGHLGHVFADGPEPTGLRYCINAVALDFRPAQ